MLNEDKEMKVIIPKKYEEATYKLTKPNEDISTWVFDLVVHVNKLPSAKNLNGNKNTWQTLLKSNNYVIQESETVFNDFIEIANELETQIKYLIEDNNYIKDDELFLNGNYIEKFMTKYISSKYKHIEVMIDKLVNKYGDVLNAKYKCGEIVYILSFCYSLLEMLHLDKTFDNGKEPELFKHYKKRSDLGFERIDRIDKLLKKYNGHTTIKYQLFYNEYNSFELASIANDIFSPVLYEVMCQLQGMDKDYKRWDVCKTCGSVFRKKPSHKMHCDKCNSERNRNRQKEFRNKKNTK